MLADPLKDKSGFVMIDDKIGDNAAMNIVSYIFTSFVFRLLNYVFKSAI